MTPTHYAPAASFLANVKKSFLSSLIVESDNPLDGVEKNSPEYLLFSFSVSVTVYLRLRELRNGFTSDQYESHKLP